MTAQIAKRNHSIDIFRLLCSVLVVIIHSSFWYNWGRVGVFIGEILPRIAVPFFFAVSGYFYIKNLESGKHVFVKQIKHLLIIYAVWSIIYGIIAFIEQVICGNIGIVSFCKDQFFAFVIYGSTGHFWFFPAIIIATCMVTLFYKAKLSKLLLPISILLYMIGCLGCSYFRIGSKIPLLGDLFSHSLFETVRRIFLMGFPFFCLGYLIMKLETAFADTKRIYLAWSIACCAFLAEIYLLYYFDLPSNIIITVGLYPLLLFTILVLLKHPMQKHGNTAALFRTIANFTYYSHPLFQKRFTSLAQSLGISLPDLALFFITLLITFALGLLLHWLYGKKKIKITKYLTG